MKKVYKSNVFLNKKKHRRLKSNDAHDCAQIFLTRTLNITELNKKSQQ